MPTAHSATDCRKGKKIRLSVALLPLSGNGGAERWGVVIVPRYQWEGALMNDAVYHRAGATKN